MDRTTLVVGAGPSGLAVAASLRQRGLPFVLLEQGQNIGERWHHHYRRLHLHTEKKFSALPGLPFPEDYPVYVPRLKLIEYMESYAQKFDLRPRFGEKVLEVKRDQSNWILVSKSGEKTYHYSVPNLVIATGFNDIPVYPADGEYQAFHGQILHSSQYDSGEAFKGKKVLVVGFGNSGSEIAYDLAEKGAKVVASVRGPMHVVPRDVGPLSAQQISIWNQHLPARWVDALSKPILQASIGDLSQFGIVRPQDGVVYLSRTQGKIPTINSGFLEFVKNGKIKIQAGIEKYVSDGVIFKGSSGDVVSFDVILFATGYRSSLPQVFKSVPQSVSLFDSNGYPRRDLAVNLPLSGLYFVGFKNPITGMLHQIAIDSEKTAETIFRNSS